MIMYNLNGTFIVPFFLDKITVKMGILWGVWDDYVGLYKYNRFYL